MLREQRAVFEATVLSRSVYVNLKLTKLLLINSYNFDNCI